MTELNGPLLSRADIYYAWRGMRLSERAANILAHHNIATPEAALALGEDGLLRLRHLGRVSVAEILTRCEAISAGRPALIGDAASMAPVAARGTPARLAEGVPGRVSSSQLAGVATGRLIEELLRRGYKLTIERSPSGQA